MDRRSFLKTSAIGSAAIAATSVLPGCASGASKDGKKTCCENVPLNISFQEGIAPGETLAEKLDFMENLGVVGFEPSGRGLKGRVKEIQDALNGRNIKVSAICAGFDGFILAEDPAVKNQFDTTMREIIEAAGELGSTGVIMVPAFNGQKPCMPHTMETRDYLCEELHKLGEFAKSCGFMSAGKQYLQHVHMASRGNRRMPGEDGELDNYVEGFKALQQLGYDKYVSFECGCGGDRATLVTAAVNLLRAQWEEAAACC